MSESETPNGPSKDNKLKVAKPAGEEVYNFEFDGKWLELLLIMIKNVVLTVFSLGIYNFWGRTNTRRYLWQHIKFNGDRAEYTGTGKELFIGFLKIFGGYITIAIVIGLLNKFAPLLGKIAGGLVAAAFLFLIPCAIYMSRNYRLTRTKWRGIMLGMDKDMAGFVKVFVLGYLGTIFSLGIYTPWFANNLHGALKNRTYFGTQKMSYDGKGGEVFWQYVFLLFSLGLYFPWFIAHISRYQAAHTSLGEARMVMKVTGLEMLGLFFLNLVLTLVSLGLAVPFVICHTLDFFTYRTAWVGKLDFAAIGQGANKGLGLGDELGGMLDVDIGM